MDPALTVQPEVAYISLVLSGLPAVLRGLFIFGMMGAIISTIDSYYLIGGEILANDIISPLRKKPLTDRQSIWTTRVACVAFGIIGLAVAFRFALVYDAMIFVTSLSMSVLFVPVIVAIMYEGKKTNAAGLASMFVGGAAWIWFTYNPLSIAVLGGEIDASLVALPLSLVAFLIGNCFGKELNRGFAPTSGNGIGATIDTDAISIEEYKEETKVEWLGVDGALESPAWRTQPPL